ncbi:MAG: NYN domain-containing protein [Candidatus Nanoarchaeia archaeon]|nr:NYN domain-containing protein [Candidatus Nanoarchaeia archaeon]MDD5741492.1 NYN domain-containing protein [Candidatus Nanoarchaeia archaeon]
MADKKKERISIFIDGSNLYHSLKRLNISKIDFQKLINKLKNNRKIVSVFYYNAPLDINYNLKTYWEQQRFFDELRKLSLFKVILCKMRKIRKEGKIIDYEVKGDDVHLTVDLISGAYENLYDVAIIVSGDEDFVPALKKVQQLGKKVENAYFISSSSSALKHSSNVSICINKFIKEII